MDRDEEAIEHRLSGDVDALMAANVEAVEVLKGVRGWSIMDSAAIAEAIAKLKGVAAVVGDAELEVS